MKRRKLNIKEVFTPKLPEPNYTLLASPRFIGENESERNHRDNIETIMSEDLKLQWEAQRRTLILVQRTLLVSILSVTIALAALIISFAK